LTISMVPPGRELPHRLRMRQFLASKPTDSGSWGLPQDCRGSLHEPMRED